MKISRDSHPDTRRLLPPGIPQRRYRSRFAKIVAPFSLVILAGCYQTPELVDPLKWAEKALIEFDDAANQMERYLFDGAVPGADGSQGETESAGAETPQAKMAMKPSKPALPVAMSSQPVTALPYDIPRNPAAIEMAAAASSKQTSAREREVLQGLLAATDNETGAARPMPVTEVAAHGNAPMSLTPQGKKMEPADKVMHGREFAVHLASYREMKNLRNDWKRMVKRHPEFLMGLKPRVATVDLGPTKGTFHRLKAGPLPSRKFATRLCKSLRDRGMYCVVMRYSGRQLATMRGTPKS